MELSPWTLYWVTRLDDVNALCAGVLVVLGVLMFCITIGILSDRNLGTEWWPRVAKMAGVFAIVAIIGAATPTTKQLATIILLPKIANSTTVQAETGELYGLAKQWLTEQVNTKEK